MTIAVVENVIEDDWARRVIKGDYVQFNVRDGVVAGLHPAMSLERDEHHFWGCEEGRLKNPAFLLPEEAKFLLGKIDRLKRDYKDREQSLEQAILPEVWREMAKRTGIEVYLH